MDSQFLIHSQLRDGACRSGNLSAANGERRTRDLHSHATAPAVFSCYGPRSRLPEILPD